MRAFSLFLALAFTTSRALAADTDAADAVEASYYDYKPTPRPKCTVKSRNNVNISDVPAIRAAFRKCGKGGIIEFTKKTTYHINELLVMEGCKGCEVIIEGTLLMSDNIAYWQANWISHPFQNSKLALVVSGATDAYFHSPSRTGTIDGNAQTWMNANPNGALIRPHLWTTANSTRVRYDGLFFRQSPMWFNFITDSSYITYTNTKLRERTTDPVNAILRNNDGWDTYRSHHVTIRNVDYEAGDDCVSFKPNSTDITIENLYCAGSHGVSVGSLAQYPGVHDIVKNVYVRNVTFVDRTYDGVHTLAGVRIKTWPGGYGTGEVSNITYEDIYSHAVDFPIQVDSCYSTNATYCETHPSQVNITNVHVRRVSGTSSGAQGQQVASIICSPGGVCELNFEDIDLHPPSGDPVYTCRDVSNLETIGIPCVAPTV